MDESINTGLPMLQKRVILAILMHGVSFIVVADCREDCQTEYDECMELSRATGKAKICGEILHECKLACAEAGE